MSKSVISEGKTTQEAIEKGLKEIKLPRELCEIKILEENKKSFFDILAPKIVRVEIKEIEARKPEEVEIETTDEELNIAKKDVEEFLNEFLNKGYEGLMREPFYGKNSRYNQHFNENVMLIEIGGPESTINEVSLSVKAFAESLSNLLGEDYGR